MSPTKKPVAKRRNPSPPPPPGYSRYKCVPGTRRMQLTRSSTIAAMRRLRGCQGGVKITSCDSDEEENELVPGKKSRVMKGSGSGGVEGSGSGVPVVSGLPCTGKGVAPPEVEVVEGSGGDTEEEVEVAEPNSPSPTVVIDLEEGEDADPGTTESQRNRVRSGPPAADSDGGSEPEYYMWFY